MKKTIISILLIFALVVSVLPTAIAAAGSEAAKTGTDPSDIVSISAGSTMSAAVRADGSLWTWGCGNCIERYIYYADVDIRNKCLGIADGTFVEATPMMAFSSGTQSVVCSRNYAETNFSKYPSSSWLAAPITAVIKADGSLWMWGGNKNGALGTGDSNYTWKPFKVLENVISYDTSGYHSAAVTSDGSLYMWGRNNMGQLGDNTTEDKSVPTKIMNNVVSVSLGDYFSAALKKDGSLWTWGANSYGQLGVRTADSNANPAPVKILENVKSLSMGSDYGLAIRTDGSVWAWGRNSVGELGLGNTDNQYTPVLNENFANDVSVVEAGSNHSAAILKNGDLYVWGANDYGQIGDNSTEIKTRPQKRIMRGVKQVALSAYHTIALKNDNTLWAWGMNTSGQLGDRTTERRLSPVEIALGQIDASFQGAYMPENQTLDIPWDDTYLYDSSYNYNKNMAISGIVLSEAVYSNTNVFNQFGYRYAYSGESTGVHPAFYVGYKVIWNFNSPIIQIIMAIRGTKLDADDGGGDIAENVRSVKDSFDGAGASLVNQLAVAENNIISNLKKDNISVSLTKSRTKYFITGHSLGGACAGKVGTILVDDGAVFDSNLYVYTYASPTNNTDPYKNNMVSRLFNVIHGCDTVVPNIPGFMYNNIGFRIPAWRVGHDNFYYNVGENNPVYMNALYQLYGEYPWDMYTPHKAHMTPSYLAALLSDEPSSTVNKVFSRARLVSVHCPVDVAVYDPDGNLCAHTKGEEVIYEKNSPVIIDIEGDEKYIQIPDDREYTIRYTGTDSGTMKVEDQIFNIETGELEYNKVFENIALEDGKLLASNIDGADDTENTDLYVIDEEGDSVSTVDQSGQETLLGEYDLNGDDVILPTGNFLYSGEAIEPEAGVKDLVEGVDYRVIYKNNTSTGTATVVVKGINDYRGRYTSYFSIYGNGDADGNGDIEAIDVTLIQRFIANIATPYTAKQLLNGDVDSSGELEVTDATAIQYYLAQMKTPYLIGKTD